MSDAHLLLERETELELLAGLLADLGSSGGKVVLIRGEAGIGKTTLVREFLDRSSAAAHVLVGACDDLLTARPLGPFRDMARDEAGLLDSLEAGSETAVMDSVLDLVSRRMRPTILVIEDTHWADEATLDVVRILGRRIRDTNGLLVLTYRDGEVDLEHPLRGVMGVLPADSVVRIRLAGLSLEGISLLAAGSSLDPIEMASGDGEVVPDSVQDSVMARVQKMSPKAQDVLRLLSVIPERMTSAVTQRIVAQNEEALGECESWGFLETQDGMVGFRHELIRRAVEASLTGPQKASANQQILESLPPWTDLAVLAHHARQANDIERLIEYAPPAAQAARAVNSHQEAVGHYLSLDPYLDRLEPPHRARVLEDWAQSEYLLERLAEAIDRLNRALDVYRSVSDEAAQGRCLNFAVRLNEIAKRPTEADRCIAEAIEILEPLGPTNELAFAVSQQAWLSMMRGEFSRAAAIADGAIRLAEETGNEAALITALNTKGVATYRPGDQSGIAAFEEAWRRARDTGNAEEEVRALHNLANSALSFRNLELARRTATRTADAAAKYKLPNLEKTAQADSATVLLYEGDWDAAEELAAEALDATPDRSSAAARELYWLLGTIQTRRGHPQARDNLERSWSVMGKSRELLHMVNDAVSLTEGMWLTGELDPDRTASFRKLLEEVIPLGHAWATGELALWMWRIGELAEIPEGIAKPCRLIMEGEPVAAAKIWEKLGFPYERALALSHGDTTAQLEALEIVNELGATAVADKLRRALRDQGVSVPHLRRKGDPTGGLTPRQAEVLSLLAEQLSNVDIADRLFLSPRTVENHVAAVMAKLAARTRNEAVATAAEQGLLAGR
jgi:DNA-binding CsgD family transcriptional regulator/tetratricopeptide (TPR) repeat protein